MGELKHAAEGNPGGRLRFHVIILRPADSSDLLEVLQVLINPQIIVVSQTEHAHTHTLVCHSKNQGINCFVIPVGINCFDIPFGISAIQVLANWLNSLRIVVTYISCWLSVSFKPTNCLISILLVVIRHISFRCNRRSRIM